MNSNTKLWTESVFKLFENQGITIFSTEVDGLYKAEKSEEDKFSFFIQPNDRGMILTHQVFFKNINYEDINFINAILTITKVYAPKDDDEDEIRIETTIPPLMKVDDSVIALYKVFIDEIGLALEKLQLAKDKIYDDEKREIPISKEKHGVDANSNLVKPEKEGANDLSQKPANVSNHGIYKIKDTKMILVVLLATFVLMGFALVGNAEYIKSWIDDSYKRDEWADFAIIYNILLVAVSARLRAIWDGAKIDIINRTIEFGGGGVAANNISDYFNPAFIFQYFTRTRINLDEISSLDQQRVTKRTWNKNTRQFMESTTYYIRISGTFGAASIPFMSEGKCDELFAAIRELNRMGAPIFNT